MYTHFFGFKERPFKLVPNPDYLYLSHSHEEALAHLTYAVSDGDGFLTITGEVGTGKTTLCRSFLEKLDNQTAVAYIFNPKLDAVQLLQAINDEFEIRSDFNSTKDLIDTLNRFLIEKKQEGKKAVLLIDEAQNLDIDVLEQLRLLSNLETTQEKLLQIILVGQPELFELLDSRALRQLTQRITLRRHLMPLNAKEVKEYIAHRLNMASQKSQIKFTGSALRTIYAYSNGIPRLVNIVCDRALLTAYGLNKKKITGNVVKSAIRELNVSGNKSRPGFFDSYKVPALLSLLLLSAILWGIFHSNDFFGLRSLVPEGKSISLSIPTQAKPIPPETGPQNNRTLAPTAVPEKTIGPSIADAPSLQPLPPEAIISDVEAGAVENTGSDTRQIDTAMAAEKTNDSTTTTAPVPKPLSLKEYIETLDIEASREKSMKAVLDLWAIPHTMTLNSDPIQDDGKFFLLTAQQNGLALHAAKNNLELAKRLNLPFVLEIYWPEKLAQIYLTVYRIDQKQGVTDRFYLKSGPEDTGIIFDQQELEPFLGEHAYVFWKNFYGYSGIIPTSSSENSILTLKLHIREMGFPAVDITPYYDIKTRNIIKNIQNKYQIETDGLVGPITKITLYNETPSLPIPHILN